MGLSTDKNGLPFIPVVFFDLDETVISRHTDGLWARFIATRNPLEFIGMRRFRNLYGLYKRGELEGEHLAEFYMFRAEKYSVSGMRTLAEEFFVKTGRKHMYPEAADRVNSHRDAGSTVVLLTAQHDIIAEPFARYLGMVLIANRFETEKDRFTGDHVLPYTFREGKIHWAEKFAMEKGCALRDCGFYTDSHNDIFMLEKVGHPFTVNPDPGLKEHALKNNWPVYEWKLPNK